MPHADLYGELRCQLLSRHYALGRYWRTNHFTSLNNQLAAWPLPIDGNPRNFVCLAADGTTTCDSLGQRPKRWIDNNSNIPNPALPQQPIYPSANALIPYDPRSPIGIERWRVFRRDRSNSLMATGLRLISLCVDYQLGDPWAATTIKLTLDTLGSLFKFASPNNPYSGYILRWDPASSDNWSVTVKMDGYETPHSCCDFLLNPDPNTFKDQPFLYCSPFTDPRYTRLNDKGIYRRWEPSIDEYVGLLTGYCRVWDTFSAVQTSPLTPHILQQVKDQVNMIGAYFQHVGYILVRPGPAPQSGSVNGFTGNGAAGFNCCMQFAFSRIFQRITGNAYTPDPVHATFENALKLAGVWDMWNHYTDYPSLGDALHVLQQQQFWPPLKQILGQDPQDALNSLLGSPAAAATIGFAAQVFLKPDCFDVLSTDPQNDVCEGLTQFALAAILDPFARHDSKKLFNGWMGLPANPLFRPGGDRFKFWLGLSALEDHQDTTVKDAYRSWYSSVLTKMYAAGVNPAATDEIMNKERWCEEAFGTAVYNLLSPGDPNLGNLEGIVSKKLAQMRQTLLDTFKGKLVLGDDNDNCTHEWHDRLGDTYFGYMSTLSLAWLQQLRRNNTNSTGEPTPTPAVAQNWTRPLVPKEVIQAAHQRCWPVPIGDIHIGPYPAADSLDLFLINNMDPNGVPHKRPDNQCGDPPAPVPGPTFNIDLKAYSTPLPPPGTPLSITVRFSQPLPPQPLNPVLGNANWTCVPVYQSGFSRKNVLREHFSIDSAHHMGVFEIEFEVFRVVYTIVLGVPVVGPPLLLGPGEFKGQCALTWMAC